MQESKSSWGKWKVGSERMKRDTMITADVVCFVEEETEVGEDDPELLPAVAVLELPQQVAAQLVLNTHKQTYMQ